MSLTSRSRLTPQCTECMRNFAYGYLKEARRALGSIEHVRGKKQKNRGPLTIPVRLLADMSAFGRKGSIVPVSVGLMRNFWYSQRLADYLPESERRLMKKNKTVPERDFGFLTAEDLERLPKEKPVEVAPTPERAAPAVQRMSAQRAMELVDSLVPKTLEFYRSVIAETPTEAPAAPAVSAPPSSEDDDAASVLFALRTEDARKAQEEAARKAPKATYGSVSTQDVLQAVKTILNLDSEGAKVALEEKDIVFVVQDGEDTTRIKKTGTYEYTITVRGSLAPARRKVTIHAEAEKSTA